MYNNMHAIFIEKKWENSIVKLHIYESQLQTLLILSCRYGYVWFNKTSCLSLVKMKIKKERAFLPLLEVNDRTVTTTWNGTCNTRSWIFNSRILGLCGEFCGWETNFSGRGRGSEVWNPPPKIMFYLQNSAATPYNPHFIIKKIVKYLWLKKVTEVLTSPGRYLSHNKPTFY